MFMAAKLFVSLSVCDEGEGVHCSYHLKTLTLEACCRNVKSVKILMLKLSGMLVYSRTLHYPITCVPAVQINEAH